ncbi:MAG TPA: AraC family transcriptional regulator [Polyangiaceae bacterium]|nr:AraC family transcriptional regulator [Polyangiaceae bacterium]
MADSPPRALHQDFLPGGGERAFVWKYSDPIGGRRPRHFHGEPEINVVVRGAATFGVGDRVLRVSQGELVAFPSGQDHALLEPSADLYLFAVGLKAQYSLRVLNGESPLPLHVRPDASELRAIVEGAAEIVDRPSSEQLGAELWERIHWVSRRSGTFGGPAVHVLTRRTLQRLQSAPELGLEALAAELGAHPTEISRHFHRDMGMTLVRYRTRHRLMRLMELVDGGQWQLTAAASSAGFGSYSQCHRAFQAELGCAPRQFFSSGERERMQLVYAEPTEGCAAPAQNCVKNFQDS